MAFIYDLTDTWNNAGTSFNGIKLNATDTASAAGSKLLDLQINGASKLAVGKTGTVTATGIIESTVGGFKFPDATTQTTKATVNSVSGTGSVNGITLSGSVTNTGSLTLGGTLGNIANNQLSNSAITINGTSTALGGSIAVGTVTSVGGTGTVSGLSLTGSVTTSGSLTLGGTLVLTSGQVTDGLGYTPYNATNPTGYITAAALTPYLTSATAATTYQPLDGDLTAIAALAGTAGLVRKTAANTYSLDTAVYITGITSGDVTTALGFTPYNATNPSNYLSSVSLTSNVTGTLPIANGGTGATTAPLARTALGLGTAAVLNSGVAGGVATLDGSGTVPTSQLPGAVLGGLNYQGTWNASTNVPTLASSVGSKGYYYVVSTAGSTNLNGITDWKIGDWAVYDGSTWQKVDNTDAVSSVNGFTGAVVLTTTDVAQGTNLYFTQAAARGSVSAGTGISYNSTSGVITNSAPDQTVALTGAGTTVVTGTYPNFTITSNDSIVGTVTSVSGTGTVSGLSLSGTVTTSGNLTLGGTLAVTPSNFASQTANTVLAAPNGAAGVPTFRAIVAADIPTLNQNTTGTAANVTGTVAVGNGGTGTATAFTAGSVAFAGASGVYSQDNANLFWDDTNNRLGIGTTTPAQKLSVAGTIESTTGGVIVPDQLAYDFATSNLPTTRPALSLDFVDVGALDPRVTFTRSSTATFYDGKTQSLAEQNLLTYSQEIGGTNWLPDDVTVTINSIAAPDGTLTASTLTDTATNSDHRAISGGTNPSFTAGVSYTLSVYVKNNTRNFVQLAFATAPFSATAYANFDVATGVLGTVGSGTTASITAVGSGWYRCAITVTATTTASAAIFFGLITSATAVRAELYAGTGQSIYIWGAQLEQRATATAYTPTTTTAITRYQPTLVTAAINASRFDYDPVTLAPKGLLIEEARTNFLIRSEEFDNAAWLKLGATITANTTTSPDGTVDADRLVEDTSTGGHVVYQTASFVSGTSYTVTVFAKAGTRTRLNMINVGGALFEGYFDLSNGTIISTPTGTSAITPMGNGWYRCQMTATAGSTTSSNVQFRLVSTGTTTSYTGDGTSGLFLWGAQLEAGAFATSYIPTVASQVTRTADLCSIVAPNFAPWFNPSEGTFVFEGTVSTLSGFTWPVIASNNTVAQAFAMYRSGASVAGFIASSSVTQMEITSSPVVVNVPFKMAVSARANDGNFSFNGNIGTNDTSITMPAVSRLSLGANANGSAEYLNGHIRSLTYYNTRLPNAVLQGITS